MTAHYCPPLNILHPKKYDVTIFQERVEFNSDVRYYGRLQMGDRLGEGSYGNVYVFPAAGRNKCIKVLHDKMCDSQFHQMSFGSLLTDFGAASAASTDWIRQHFVVPEQVYRLLDGRRGIVMDIHVEDLYKHVRVRGRIIGGSFMRLKASLCDAVGFLLERQIFFCDLSPGNTLLGADGVWRITDADLWRGCERKDVPSYCICMRAPELLLRTPRIDMAACEVWALGVLLDFANRGRLVFGYGDSVEETLQNIVNMYASALPDFLRGYRRSAQVHSDALDSPPQWSVYRDFLNLRPECRCKPGGVAVEWPTVPWKRISGRRIDMRAREAYALVLWGLFEAHQDAQPVCALAALSLVDLYLATAQFCVPTVQTRVAIAVVYLAQVHTQCYIRRYTDLCETIRQAHGPATDEDVLATAEELMRESFWQPPLGKHVWHDVDWTEVQNMIYCPVTTYARFQ